MAGIRRRLMLLKRGAAPVVVLPSFTTPTFSGNTTSAFVAACTMTPGNIAVTRQGFCYSTSQNPTINDNVAEVTPGTTSISKTIQYLSQNWYSGQDNTIYTEPDGSQWYHISHDNNPASYSLSLSNWNDVSSQYISADKWLSTKYDRYLDRHEYLIKQAETSGGTESKWRWSQPKSLCRSAYAHAAVAEITKNTDSGYASWATNYGGLYSSGHNCVYQQNNGTFGNTWGRICAYKRYNNGNAGFNGVTVTTGYTDLYVRIDNAGFLLKDGTTYYVRAFAVCSNGQVVYSGESSAATLSYSLPSGVAASASSIAQTTATYSGTWSSNGNSGCTNTIFTTDTSSGVSIANSSTIQSVNDTASPVSLSKTGLTANTQYYMRFFVMNEVGLVGCSSVSVKTLANLTPPIITSVTWSTYVTQSGSGNDYFRFKATFNPNGKNITAWGAQYVCNKSATDTSGYKTYNNTTTISSTSTKTITCSSVSIYVGQTYAHYRAFATNADGTTYSSWSHHKCT